MEKRRVSHYDFLDGIKAFAAFYVLLTHVYYMLTYAGAGLHGKWAGRIMVGLKPLAYGRYAVDMFIVLSGFCLMLPVVRSGGLLKDGFTGYIKRRARRIVPPYYISLVVALLILLVRHRWFDPATSGAAHADHLPGWGDWLSHLLLLQNLSDRWARSINAPMWTVASEWQIYFFFPALLLPVWKRWNITATIATGFTVGYALHLLVPGGLNDAVPWYIGLFTLGMAGVQFTTPAGDAAPEGRSVPWGKLCCGLALLLAVTGALAGGWFRDHGWLIDPIFGLAAISLINYCVLAVPVDMTSPQPFPLAVLRSRWAVSFGTFSYSMYLIHYPLLELTYSLFRYYALSPLVQIAITFGICVPAIIGLAYLFHLAFERPFMPGHPQTRRKAQVAAAISLAP